MCKYIYKQLTLYNCVYIYIYICPANPSLGRSMMSQTDPKYIPKNEYN